MSSLVTYVTAVFRPASSSFLLVAFISCHTFQAKTLKYFFKIFYTQHCLVGVENQIRNIQLLQAYSFHPITVQQGRCAACS